MQQVTTSKVSPQSREVVALAEHEGPPVWFLDALVTVKLGASDGADFGLLAYDMPSGSRTPLHRHLAEDEAVYVVSGALRVVLEERVIGAGPGAYVHLPRGVAHGLIADVDTRLLVISRPDGFVEFARELGAPAPRRELPPAAPPDMARLLELAAKYQIEILGPLPA